MCEKYNGWSNYETWLVKLWLDNEQPTNEDMNREARHAVSVGKFADYIKEYVNELYGIPEIMDRNGLVTDLLNGALSSVDWYEIAQSYMDDNETGEV